MPLRKLEILENRFLRVFSLLLIVIYTIWMVKDILTKNFIFIGFDLSVIIITFIYFISDYKLKKNKIFLSAFLLLIILDIFSFYFFYKISSLILFCFPLILTIIFLFDLKKDNYIIFSFIVFILGFVAFYYLTIDKWPEIRHNEIGTINDSIDDFEAIVLSLTLVYFIGKKHYLSLEINNELLKNNETLKDTFNKMTTSDGIDEQRLKEIKWHVMNDYSSFYGVFKKYYPNFVYRMMDIAPNLVADEMNIVALLKMNFTTKEIAIITNSTIRAIEAKKYRLRKKLQIPHEKDLVMFLHTL